MKWALVFYLLLGITTLQVFSQQDRTTGGDTLYQADCGILWEPPIQLTDTTYAAYMPKIALSGDDTIHVTWVEDYAKHRLPYARCINGIWEPVIDLIKDTITYPNRFWSNFIVAQNQSVYMFSAGEPTSQTTSPREIRMHKSTDGGTSWSSPFIIGPDSSNGLFSVSLYNDTIVVVYAPWKSGYSKRPMMIVSTDAGETWTKRPDTLDGWTRTALTPGTLHLVRDVFVNGAQEKLYMRSFDLGNTWVDKETLSTVDGKWSNEHCIASNSSSNESHLFVAWRDEMIACAGMVGCIIMSRESYTNGNDWNSQVPLTEEPRGYNPDAAISDDNKTVVAWTSELLFVSDHVVTRVRKHPDSSWTSIVDHTPKSRVAGLQKVAISKKAIHIVWTQSVESSNEKFCIFYRRGRFLTTDIKEENKELPQEFLLSHNYPNPFNPTTRIKYKLQNTQYVSIKVYDVFGREVSTLVNEKKQPGEYEVEWTAEKFSSGVYFIRMNAGNYFVTKKAILLR